MAVILRAGPLPAPANATNTQLGPPTRVVTRIITDGEVDLALEFSYIIMAEAAYGANAEMLRTTEEMERQFINVIA